LKAELGFRFHLINESKTKKGYSGVAVFSKQEPLQVLNDFPHNEEGRVICLEYSKFYLVNAYVPNVKPDLSRLAYRIETWESSIREYINTLQKKKPVVYTADFNVAPDTIDIHTTKGHTRSAGFTLEERHAYSLMLDSCKLVDTFRYLHPSERKYSWFSNFGKARENYKGWRIDGFVVSQSLTSQIKQADILDTYKGSDHVPVLLELF
jgi:exodeoxyribonuclease-3